MFTAPILDDYIRGSHGDSWKNETYTQETVDSIHKLFTAIEQIKPLQRTDYPGYSDPDKRYAFWIKLSTGTLDDYMQSLSTEDLFEDEIEDIKTDWLETYTEPEYWYLVTAIRTEKDTYAVYLNGRRAAQYNNAEQPAAYGFNKVELMDALTEKTNETVKMLQDGSYNEFLKHLPDRYKHGIIAMRKYLETYPNAKDRLLYGLAENEIIEFTAAYEKYIKNREGIEIPKDSEFFYVDKGTLNAPVIADMTVNKYLKISALGYRNVFKNAAAAKTPLEMYKRWADGRDGGFLKLSDPDDPEAFNKWFALDTMGKWEIDNPSHLWEAIAGGSRTRLMLFPVYNEKAKGFYFDLSNSEYCCVDELVRFYLALLHAGIPVCVRGMGKIAKYLNLELNIGIVPCYEEPSGYMYGGFPDEEAISFIQIDSDTEKITPYAEWYPEETVELKNEYCGLIK